MPIVTVYHHGTTLGMPPSKNDHPRAKRNVVTGWTARSARGNTNFLRSVHLPSLTGFGISFTLTVKDCPPSHDDWQTLRESLVKRLRRNGFVRLHWVTEWQRRGVPHLHGVVYFPGDYSLPKYAEYSRLIEQHWLQLTGKYGAKSSGQHCRPISDALGWLQYLGKHAARGASHYQRSPENVPKGWKKTGRMWGYSGDWPVDSPMKFEISRDAYFRLRRLMRSWRKSHARQHLRKYGDPSRIPGAREMLQVKGAQDAYEAAKVRKQDSRYTYAEYIRRKSETVGVSEWVPEDVQLQLFHLIATSGETIEQID